MVNEIDRHILARLSGSSSPLPGTVLAEELGMTRVALWKRIRLLSAQGCRIESSRKGYTLLEEDLWQAPEGEPELPLVYFRETESTMDEAWKLAEAGALHGTVVSAETQSRGRGQRDRTWTSPAGGFYLTIILRCPLPQTWSGALVMEASWTVLDILDGAGLKNLEFQWPNDFYLDQRKVGGLLVESAGSPGSPRFYILGLGLNFRPVLLEDRPAAALQETGLSLPRRRNLAGEFQRRMAAWSRDPLCDPEKWKRRLLRTPSVLKAVTWQGTVKHLVPGGLEPDGSLTCQRGNVRLGFGETVKVWKESSG